MKGWLKDYQPIGTFSKPAELPGVCFVVKETPQQSNSNVVTKEMLELATKPHNFGSEWPLVICYKYTK